MIMNELNKFQNTYNQQVSIMGSKFENDQIFAFQGFDLLFLFKILKVIK